MSVAGVDSLYADAYAFIEQGLCYDEVDDKGNARVMYERSLEVGEQALRMDQKSPLREGLIRVRKLVEERVNNIKQNISIGNREINEIRSSLDSISNSHDAELFYWLPNGVQLVTIEDGNANAPSPPSSLAIYKLNQNELSDSQEGKSVPAALIQVGPWAYPLFPTKSTILKNQLGIYVVPNPTFEHPNMYVGIILPREIESRLEDEFVYALEQFSILKTSRIVEEMSTEQRLRTSERVAQLLIRSGEILAQNTQNVANKTGKYVAEKGEYYRTNMEASDHPVNISPAIRHGVVILHNGSKVVAKVTRFLLDKIGDVGIALGQRVADSFSGESTGGRAFRSTVTVLGGGLTAFSTVWISLEDASKTLMRSIANETIQTVHLRYGDEASTTAHHALHAVGHTTLAGFQLYEFGPRSIAGRMARKAGLQFLQGVSRDESVNRAADQTCSNDLKSQVKT